MAAHARSKSVDRASVIKKLLPLIKKHCKVVIPKLDRPVMESMLYAVCLENATVEQAEQAYARLFELYPDLNEARVSSISELEPIFSGLDEPDWRAFRARAVLQYVFEKSFTFELEGLRKKTLEIAAKQLAKIRHLTPFVRAFTLQQAIGAHQIPLDDASLRVLVWLGLASPGQSVEEVSESLKGVVRKNEVVQFCFTLRALATDPNWKAAFVPSESPGGNSAPHDLSTALDRLNDLFKHGLAAPAKPKPVKPVKKPEKAEKAGKAKATSSKKPKKTAKTSSK